ncbi:MAG: hypothetical protein R3E42_04860 [Burkholderiaceae bacterium]
MVRIRFEGHTVDTGMMGLQRDARLYRLIDGQRGVVGMPERGVVLSAMLAREIGARVGDRVTLEFRLNQTRAEVEVADIAQTMFGKLVYMSLPATNRLARDGDGVADAAMQIDPLAMDAFWAAVKAAPGINSVFDKASSMESFDRTTSRNMGVFSTILTVFAVAMAVGIVYNSARISLSERAWELASLRVLGIDPRRGIGLAVGRAGRRAAAGVASGGLCWLGFGLAHDVADGVGCDRLPCGDRAQHIRLCGLHRAGCGRGQRFAGASEDRPP